MPVRGLLGSGPGRQRAHLLTELPSRAAAKVAAARSPVDTLLVTAAELHVRAGLGVVDAAERDLTADAPGTLRIPAGAVEAAPEERPQSA